MGPVLALAAATAAARAQRLDAATTAQALALALSAAGALSPAAQRASATGRGVAYAAQVMIGVDAVEQARAGAQAAAVSRGEPFSLKDFHTAALNLGSVPLEVLHRRLTASL